MKKGSFIIKGVDSDTIKTYIQDRPLIEVPLRRMNWKNAYGVDGEIPFDEGAYEDTSMELTLVVGGDDLIGDRQKVVDLFDGRGSFVEMIPYFDPTKIYRVTAREPMKFENKFYYGDVQAAQVTLRVKPYKYLVEKGNITTTSKTLSLLNPTNYTSQPIIRLKGTGVVNVIVNDTTFHIRELPGDIVLDSERYLAYRESTNGVLTNANDKVTSKEYPVFKPGNNTVEIVGDVTETTIEPRWRSLV